MLPRVWKVFGVVIVCSGLLTADVHGQRPTAKPSPAVARQPDAKLPPEVEKLLAAVEEHARQQLAGTEQNYRKFFADVRRAEDLRPFVSELVGLTEKLRLGNDLVNQTATSERIRNLFRQKVFDERELSRLSGEVVEHFNRVLADQDTALLITLKIDRDIPTTQLRRDSVDTARFRTQVSSIIDKSVAAARADVARLAAITVASEAIGHGVIEAGRQSGLMSSDDESVGSVIGGFLLDLAIGAVIEEITDPTEEIVKELQAELAAAEKAILDGTPQQPGIIRVLDKAITDRAAARRQFLLYHYSK